MQLCVPFSYFYCFSHFSIYLPLPNIISLQYISMVLLDVSSNNFLQKHYCDQFGFIFIKGLSCEISFSDFVYLLLERITFVFMYQIHSWHFQTCRFLVPGTNGAMIIFANSEVKVNGYQRIPDVRISSHDYSSIYAKTPENVDEYLVFSSSRRIHICVVLALHHS